MKPCLLILAVVAATTVAVCTMAYDLSNCPENQRRFLKSYRPPSDYEAHVEHSIRYSLRSSEANDAVFIGDSTCLCAIRTKLFEKLTNLHAYNLGCVGVLGMDGFLVLCRSYLEHHPKPFVVVLCVHPVALVAKPSALGPQSVRDQFFWSYGSVGQESHKPGERDFVYWVKEGIRTAFGNLEGGLERFASEPIAGRGDLSFKALESDLMRERGFWEHPGVMSGEAEHGIQIDDDPLAQSEFKRNLIALARLTKEHGVTLLVRFAPILTMQVRGRYDFLAKWSQELEKYSNVMLSRPEILEYPPRFFGERIHCNAAGADEFTRRVAADVMTISKLR